MTLGLATRDDDGIYLAIESEGLLAAGTTLVHQSPLRIDSKILELQSAPKIAALAAGGLDHWSYVAANYSNQLSVAAAAKEIVRLLNSCMGPQNQAYGLVCGYENGVAKCYRVNRPLRVNETEPPKEESLVNVQSLGTLPHEGVPKEWAENAIGNHVQPLIALVEAIQRQLQLPGQGIRRPIHVLIIRRAC